MPRKPLAPSDAPRRKRRKRFQPNLENVGAYDFETYEWTNPKCVGLLYGLRGNRVFHFHCDESNSKPKQVAIDALRTMASLVSRGIRFWFAHNGGKFDVLFLMEALEFLQWKFEGIISGGRVTSLEVTLPDGEQFWIHDSYAIVSSSLEKASASFELETTKLFQKDEYQTDVRQWDRYRLELGCKTDCEIVLQLISRIFTLINEHGGTLRTTAASCALSVMKHYSRIPYLRNQWGAENEMCRMAYHGGRVEVFNHIPRGFLSAYDINSSYPWSMSQPLPWEPIGFCFGREAIKQFNNEQIGGIFDATVHVGKTYLPPLPWKHPSGGLYFPTGEWRAHFVKDELEYARNLGVKVTIHSGIAFHREAPFRRFVHDFFEIKQTSTGAKREFAKLMMNAGYGKLGQNPEKEKLIVFPTEEEALEFLESQEEGACKPVSNSSFRFLAVKHFLYPPHSHFAAASTITGLSRIRLHQFASKARQPCYSDTDSVHCARGSLNKFVGENLGQLKLESAKMRALYFAPKLYVLHPEGKEPKYASKGFQVDLDTFKGIIQGDTIFRENMTLAKTQSKSGNKPTRSLSAKHWTGISIKRKPFSNGETEPWTVEELIQNKHLQAKSPAKFRGNFGL